MAKSEPPSKDKHILVWNILKPSYCKVQFQVQFSLVTKYADSVNKTFEYAIIQYSFSLALNV